MAEHVADLNDPSHLRIEGDTIHYRIYAQDGTFIPMTIRDTPHNRRFVAYVQVFDRYTEHGEGGTTHLGVIDASKDRMNERIRNGVR